uniref:Uncharacterized protein n=1 Tax=Periophthalmus magnuspinnatus TaxID=409849 RepID=A0A3B4B165_9GOBI
MQSLSGKSQFINCSALNSNKNSCNPRLFPQSVFFPPYSWPKSCSEHLGLYKSSIHFFIYDISLLLCQAVLHEIQRMGDTVPLSVFHETTRDTELMGYSIPKGITIIPNLSSALNEEGQWKFPHEFNPENFLNDKGEFVKPDAFLPFSAGPRVCPGESLARMELFLIMVTLLRRFRFIWPEDAGELDYELEFGITSILYIKMCHKFNVIMRNISGKAITSPWRQAVSKSPIRKVT